MADAQDGQPYESRSDTPDQQGAGVVNPPTMGPASLLSVLGGMGGSVPPDAMAALAGGGGPGMGGMLGLLPQPPSQASVYAQALSGGISAMRGTPDPVRGIIQDQQRQQNVIAAMMQRMSEEQRLANQWGINQARLQEGEDRREKRDIFNQQQAMKKRDQETAIMQLGLNEGMMANAPTPEGRQFLAQQRGKLNEQLMGVATPPDVIEGWAAGTPPNKERETQILMAFNTAREKNDPQLAKIATQMYRLTPDQATYYSKMVTDDAVLKAHNFPISGELKNMQTKFDLDEAKLRDSAIPFEQRHDPKWYSQMDAMAIKAYPGLHWQDLDSPQRSRVWDMVQLKDQSDQIAKHQAAATINAQKEMQVFGAKQGILQAQRQATPLGQTKTIMVNADGKLADPEWTIPEAARQKYFEISPKELDGVTKSAMALKQLEVIRDSVNALANAKLTADTPGMFGYIGDQARIAKGRYTDPKQRALLVNLEANKAELVNILRMTGDNARAAQLLIPAIQSIAPQSGAAGIRGVMANLESALRASGAASRTPGLLNNIPRVFPIPQGIPGVGRDMDQNGMTPGTRED